MLEFKLNHVNSGNSYRHNKHHFWGAKVHFRNYDRQLSCMLGYHDITAILTHCPRGDLNGILNDHFSSWFQLLMAELFFFVKLASYQGQWTLLIISQHWFRYWLGAVRQQAITWDNVDEGLCRHIVSLGHNGLTNFISHPWMLGWLHHFKQIPQWVKFQWLPICPQ